MLLRFLLTAVLFACAAMAQAQQFNLRAVVSAASSGDNTLIAAVSGKQIAVYGLDVSMASVTTFQLKCGSTAVTGAMTMNAYSKGILLTAPAYWVCPVNTALVATLGGAVQMSGTVWYTQQ